jgi:hypothetical protein
MAMRLWFAFSLLVLAAGCSTPLQVEGAPCPCPGGYFCDAQHRCVGTGTPPAPASRDSGTGPEMQIPPAACKPDPGPALVRRLDADEYANTVHDLLGVVVDTSGLQRSTQLPEPAGPQQSTSLSSDMTAQYVKAAQSAAAQAIQHLPELVPCTDPPGENTCARRFAQSFGARAYRRPLEAGELDLLMSAFEEGRRNYGGDLGIRAMIEFALTRTQFLFRSDRGTGSGPRPGIVALTQWEIATRLSYFLQATMPNETLQQQADSGGLATVEDVRAAAQALMDSPRAEPVVAAFHRRWLWLEMGQADKPPVQPPFDADLRKALVASGQRTTLLQMWKRGLDQSALFGGMLVGNRAMADFYDLSSPTGSDFEELAPMRDQKRFGIITLPGVLANLSDGAESSPTHRGHFISEEILCRPIPAPPPNVSTLPPMRTMPQTTRGRFAEHINNPSCSPCHNLMDSIGFALENYDGYGRWRNNENGQAIDASGSGVAEGQTFTGPAELANILGVNDTVSDCLVRQWFRFAVGRAIEEDSDACTLNQLHKAYLDGGRKLRPLLLAIATSEAFLTRRTP